MEKINNLTIEKALDLAFKISFESGAKKINYA